MSGSGYKKNVIILSEWVIKSITFWFKNLHNRDKVNIANSNSGSLFYLLLAALIYILNNGH